jgi:DNA-directed RNA polymerase specialized sigma24 family protein
MSEGPFARFASGDPAGAAAAAGEFGEVAFIAALGVLREPVAAEHVAVDVLFEGLTAADAIRGEAAVERLWVAAMARARALTAFNGEEARARPFWRRRKELPAHHRFELSFAFADSEAALSAFASLRPDFVTVLGLAYGAGLDAEAIATVLGVTPDEARSALGEALVAFRDELMRPAE